VLAVEGRRGLLADLMVKKHEKSTRLFWGFMSLPDDLIAVVQKKLRLVTDHDGELWMLIGKIKRVSAALQGRDEAGELWKAACIIIHKDLRDGLGFVNKLAGA
jgi:hypothetical protein